MKFKPERNFFKTPGGGTSNPIDSFHDKYYKLAKSIRNWQLAFISIMILFSISLVGLIKIATQSNIIPYIIEVNKEEGIIRNVGEINKINYQVNDKLIFSSLRNFLNLTRTIPLDPVLYGKNVNESYNFLSNVAQNKLKLIITNENVRERINKKQTRDISLTSILKVDNKNYQIRWSENNYDEYGNLESNIRYSGIFSVEIFRDDSEARILINPIGIIITDFSFSEEMQ